MTPADAGRLRDRIAAQLMPSPPDPLGAAVSGGSDSLALLTLLIDWRDAGGPAVRAVTVDHGLRAESAAEAEAVARFCAAHAVAHTTLHWQDRDGRGNLPDRARRARYDLIAKWARETGIGCVALGHTIDDLAETFLMRLARAAGVDGLAAMAGRWCQDGVSFVRPALGISREELRGLLRARGIGWADDPGNEDLTYERVRARRALVALAPLGIDAQTLAAVAANLSDVRDALDTQLAEAAARIARVEAGDVVIDRDGLTALPPETARRMLREALMWVGGGEYPPRGAALGRALEGVRAGRSLTLQGCRLIARPDTLRITREERAVLGHRVAPGAVWDGRWRLIGPWVEGATVAALGAAGLELCPEWRRSGLPAVSLRASPAVWRGSELVSAPLAGLENGWRAELLPRPRHDFPALLKH